MHSPVHPLTELFQQLGLGSSGREIEEFIRSHAPLAGDIALPDACFWNASQSSFLREALIADDDWCEIIDALDASLRSTPPVLH